MTYVKIEIGNSEGKLVAEQSRDELRVSSGEHIGVSQLDLLHEVVAQIERALTKEVPR